MRRLGFVFFTCQGSNGLPTSVFTPAGKFKNGEHRHRKDDSHKGLQEIRMGDHPGIDAAQRIDPAQESLGSKAKANHHT